MMRFKKHMNQYFTDKNERVAAEIPVAILLSRFPNSEVKLVTKEHCVFVGVTDLEDLVTIPEIVPLEKPTHAEKVLNYFAEKEKEAELIFEKIASELKKTGKAELINDLRKATTFYESGDWIDDDKQTTESESKDESSNEWKIWPYQTPTINQMMQVDCFDENKNLIHSCRAYWNGHKWVTWHGYGLEDSVEIRFRPWE